MDGMQHGEAAAEGALKQHLIDPEICIRCNTCEAMKAPGIQDPNDAERIRALGVVDLPTLQRKMNLHFSLTLDLFGN